MALIKTKEILNNHPVTYWVAMEKYDKHNKNIVGSINLGYEDKTCRENRFKPLDRMYVEFAEPLSRAELTIAKLYEKTKESNIKTRLVLDENGEPTFEDEEKTIPLMEEYESNFFADATDDI